LCRQAGISEATFYNWRHTSAIAVPSSACLRMKAIWLSLNFDLFMENPSARPSCLN
jgi:hypothetical protein